jgi:hypothetical protein
LVWNPSRKIPKWGKDQPMKILKKGREQKGWTREEICTGVGNGGGGCGAKLLVEQGDLFKTYSHARDETETFTTSVALLVGS